MQLIIVLLAHGFRKPARASKCERTCVVADRALQLLPYLDPAPRPYLGSDPYSDCNSAQYSILALT